jgi:hypothetical protein
VREKNRSFGIELAPVQQKENLENVVAMLNDQPSRQRDWRGKTYLYTFDQEDVTKLRRWVRSWQKANASVETVSALRALAKELSKEDRSELERFLEGVRVFMLPNGTLAIEDHIPRGRGQRYNLAAIEFTRLLRNPRRIFLAGPCLSCERWYIRKYIKEKPGSSRYCSNRCKGNFRKAKRRNATKAKLLEEIRKAISRYKQLPTNHRYRENGWAAFVTEATRTTKKYLTQAINRGELVPPKD